MAWPDQERAVDGVAGLRTPPRYHGLHPRGAAPGGWPGLVYLRLHGTPRVYTSAYEPGWLHRLAERIVQARRETAALWCIFDNTAEGHALRDAMALQQAVDARQEMTS